MKNIYIYCLKHPETLEIKYIGKTTNIKRRLYQHLYDSKKNISNRRAINWIKSLLALKLKPVIEVVEICNEENWQKREIYWISFYKNRFDICNHHEGGLGALGRIPNKENIDRIRKVGYLQSYFSEEQKLEIWNLIKSNYSYQEIKKLYPKFSSSSYRAIKIGALWNHITNLPKRIKTNNKGKSNYKSRKVICSINGKMWDSARMAWLELYSSMYTYNYFKCMLSGHNKNKTTISYLDSTRRQ